VVCNLLLLVLCFFCISLSQLFFCFFATDPSDYDAEHASNRNILIKLIERARLVFYMKGNQLTSPSSQHEHFLQYVNFALKNGMSEKNMIALGRSPKIYLLDMEAHLTPEPNNTLKNLKHKTCIDGLSSLQPRLGLIQTPRISASSDILVAADTKIVWTVPALNAHGDPIKILQNIGPPGSKEGQLNLGQHTIKIEDVHKPIPEIQHEEVKKALMKITFHVSYTREQVCCFETALKY
jgi:hypothetical protein